MSEQIAKGRAARFKARNNIKRWYPNYVKGFNNISEL